jgi:hypothetical protein
MPLNEELVELSQCLTEEQLVEYLIRLKEAEKRMIKILGESSS